MEATVTSLRGAAAVMLALMVLAVLFAACASEPTDPEQIRSEACADLCARLETLPCRDESSDNPDLLFTFVNSAQGCQAECAQSSLTPSACQAAYDDFVLCAADRGPECAEGPDQPFTLAGCDDEVIRYGEACGACVAMPSGEPHGCPGELQPHFLSCSKTSTQWMRYTSPFCYTACSEEPPGSNQYCCGNFWSSAECKPDAGPVCEGCN
jgi:hypothetical protein